jgi:glycerol kinase
MEQYILAIDQGTSGTKAVLFDRNGKLVRRVTAVHRQFYPQPGWVEHDAEEIYQKTLEAIHTVLQESGTVQDQIAAISISNQRETVVVWDKNTGKPVCNAVVWQCQRGSEICRRLENEGCGKMIREKTGLVLSPYFSAAKVKWILDHVEGIRERAERGELLLGTIDSWLVWKLTGGRVHATDYSNASRTQLFNIKDLKWDEDLLRIFTIPGNMVPTVKSSNAVFGFTDREQGFDREIPISGVMGDSHAALFGQNCFDRGMAKATYGTGSSIMMNIGGQPLESQNGLVTSLAWGMDGIVDYVFEGNINCTGATIKWLVEDLELIPDSRVVGQIASSVEDTGGVYLVPAFVGLSAPYWDSEARASITGMTRGTKKTHLVRAAEESIAYQIKDVLDLMIQESGINLHELRVDGGPTRDDFLMQFQADVLSVPVVRNTIEELSAIGSAFMGGLAVGFWSGKKEIEALRVSDRAFVCNMSAEKSSSLYMGWKEAVKRTLSGFQEVRQLDTKCIVQGKTGVL